MACVSFFANFDLHLARSVDKYIFSLPTENGGQTFRAFLLLFYAGKYKNEMKLWKAALFSVLTSTRKALTNDEEPFFRIHLSSMLTEQ